eukprot:scpid44356/ scgid10612/ 
MDIRAVLLVLSAIVSTEHRCLSSVIPKTTFLQHLISHVHAGSNVLLECPGVPSVQYAGKPVSWFFGSDQSVNPLPVADVRKRVDDEGKVRILNVSEADEGWYTCTWMYDNKGAADPTTIGKVHLHVIAVSVSAFTVHNGVTMNIPRVTGAINVMQNALVCIDAEMTLEDSLLARDPHWLFDGKMAEMSEPFFCYNGYIKRNGKATLRMMLLSAQPAMSGNLEFVAGRLNVKLDLTVQDAGVPEIFPGEDLFLFAHELCQEKFRNDDVTLPPPSPISSMTTRAVYDYEVIRSTPKSATALPTFRAYSTEPHTPVSVPSTEEKTSQTQPQGIPGSPTTLPITRQDKSTSSHVITSATDAQQITHGNSSISPRETTTTPTALPITQGESSTTQPEKASYSATQSITFLTAITRTLSTSLLPAFPVETTSSTWMATLRPEIGSAQRREDLPWPQYIGVGIVFVMCIGGVGLVLCIITRRLQTYRPPAVTDRHRHEEKSHFQKHSLKSGHRHGRDSRLRQGSQVPTVIAQRSLGRKTRPQHHCQLRLGMGRHREGRNTRPQQHRQLPALTARDRFWRKLRPPQNCQIRMGMAGHRAWRKRSAHQHHRLPS